MSNKTSELVEKIKCLIPYSSDEEIYGIIRDITAMVPLGENKAYYLVTLFNFLKDLSTGDDINQYINSAYVTGYAKNALDEIGEHIRTSQLKEYRSVFSPLKKNVAELSTTKTLLESEIAALKAERDNLLLSRATIESSMSQERAEVNILLEQKSDLSKSLEELKRAAKEIKESMRPKYKVEWVPITPDHPIYQTSASSFMAYIIGLKQEYKEKMGATEEEVEDTFRANMSTVDEIDRALNKLTYEEIKKVPIFSLNNVLCKNSLDCIQRIVKTLRVPVYTLVKSAMDEPSKDYGTLIRELQYKREIALAEARAQAAETNLEIALNIIKAQHPDLDLSSISNSNLDKQETEESKPSFS